MSMKIIMLNNMTKLTENYNIISQYYRIILDKNKTFLRGSRFNDNMITPNFGLARRGLKNNSGPRIGKQE